MKKEVGNEKNLPEALVLLFLRRELQRPLDPSLGVSTLVQHHLVCPSDDGVDGLVPGLDTKEPLHSSLQLGFADIEASVLLVVGLYNTLLHQLLYESVYVLVMQMHRPNHPVNGDGC